MPSSIPLDAEHPEREHDATLLTKSRQSKDAGLPQAVPQYGSAGHPSTGDDSPTTLRRTPAQDASVATREFYDGE